MQHKCDLINMSYGEPTLLPDYGRFIDLVNEVPILNTMIEVDVILIHPFFFFLSVFNIILTLGSPVSILIYLIVTDVFNP